MKYFDKNMKFGGWSLTRFVEQVPSYETVYHIILIPPPTFISREVNLINNVGIQEQSNDTLEIHTFQSELIELLKLA